MCDEYVVIPKSQYSCLSDTFHKESEIESLESNSEKNLTLQIDKQPTFATETSLKPDIEPVLQTQSDKVSEASGDSHSGSEISEDKELDSQEAKHESKFLPATSDYNRVSQIKKRSKKLKEIKEKIPESKGAKKDKKKFKKKPVKKITAHSDTLEWSQLLQKCKNKKKMEKLQLFRAYFENYATKKICKKFHNLLDLVQDAFSMKSSHVKNEECFYSLLSKLPIHVLICNTKKLQKYSNGKVRDWFKL